MVHTPLTPTFLLSCILILTIVGAGCTSPPQLDTNSTNITISTVPQTTPTPSPTPNPYGLDTDGYYIADFGYPKDRVLCSNFSINLLTPNITSGEALLFEGTTTCPPNTRIYIMKNPFDFRTGVGNTGIEEFSAPVLPGTNGTNIIKFKIPAFNIHIDYYTRKEPSFPENETYTSYISFVGNEFYVLGRKCFEFTIISDPNHPMIWDCEGRDYYTWIWTNDTTKTKYTTYFIQAGHGRRSNVSELKPCPTYPKLNNTFM
jgi:hypothetical protein